MTDNSSSVKRNQSFNFSSVATVENSSSPNPSPKKELYVPTFKRLVTDPKFSNEHVFDNQYKILHSNKSLNIKPKNGSIYLTGIGSVTDIKTDVFKNIELGSLDYSILSKSLTKKTSIIKNKSKVDPLPYITNGYHYKKNLISPLFTCCDQQLNPRILNKVLYQQKEKESMARINKTAGNESKLYSKSYHPKKIVVPDGPKDYLNKTKELNRIRYCMNLKTESIKEHKSNIKEQIKSLDFTIKSINTYKNNLENKFLSEYNKQIRALDKILLDEKIEDEKLKSQLVKIQKENTNLLYKIKKNELNTQYIEKWLILQIYIKERIHIDKKKIKNYINENYNEKLIIESPEEFDEIFKEKEKKNRQLMESLNDINREKHELYLNLEEIKENLIDKEMAIEILEKEKLLSLLKMRNNELMQERKEAIRLNNISKKVEISVKSKNLPLVTLKKNNKRDKNSNNIINFSNIFNLIQKGFDYIIKNDKETVGDYQDSLQSINKINTKSAKALSQLRMIEISYIYLFYYKVSNMQKNKKLYEKILEEIDLERKKMKSVKHKNEEKEGILELYKRLEAKKEKIIFRSRRQDPYASLIYLDKIKKESKKRNQTVKKEIDIYDFLYDIEDEKKEENKK